MAGRRLHSLSSSRSRLRLTIAAVSFGYPNEAPTALLSQVIEEGFTRDAAGATVPYRTVTSLTYDGRGQVQSIDGPLPGAGDTTVLDYESGSGNLVSVTRPLVGAAFFARSREARAALWRRFFSSSRSRSRRRSASAACGLRGSSSIPARRAQVRCGAISG